jgi:hypothetical protein
MTLSKLVGSAGDRLLGAFLAQIPAGACIPEAFRPCSCVDYYPNGPFGVLWYADCNGDCNLYHCSYCC